MDKLDQRRVSRRTLLKMAGAGVAAGLVPTIFARSGEIAYAAGAPTHLEIDPLRVAGILDPRMTTALNAQAGWADQERLVRADVVRANLDRLACALAEQRQVKDAWQRILLKPPGKVWSDVVVAIKTNEIAGGQQQSRSAVLSSICHVLTDVMGVKPSNICVYDATTGGGMPAYRGLPEGVNLTKKWGGTAASVPVPAPYKGGAATARCLKTLADGTVDILVNLALCKGHSNSFGGFTMAMKNHLGTFEPGPVHQGGGGPDYLIGINKSPQILGTLDQRSGKVLFPRQQLCIMDALWASKGGPGGNPSAQPNSLFMGTCGPVLDYQVATKFRRDSMKWQINEPVTLRYLKEFGFDPADLPNGGRIIEPAA